MKKLLFGAVALAALGLAAPATAATLNVNTVFTIDNQVWTTPNCPGAITGGGGGVVTCTEASSASNYSEDIGFTTRADPGSIGIKGHMTESSDFYLFRTASVGQYYFDTLTFGIQSGTFLLPVDVAGSLDAPIASESVTGGGGGASAQIDVGIYGTNTYTSVFHEGISSTTGLGTSIERTGSLGTTVVPLSIVNGQVNLTASMEGQFQCDGRFDGGPCAPSIDFFDSARFLAATVLDANGNVVANPTITSASGFDYLTGLLPHQPSPVPLPASAFLLGGALAGLAGFRRRGRRAA